MPSPAIAPPHRLEHTLGDLRDHAANRRGGGGDRISSPSAFSSGVIQAKFSAQAYQNALQLGNHAAAARHLSGASAQERQDAIQTTADQHLDQLFQNTNHPRTRLDLWQRHHGRQARTTFLANQTAWQQHIYTGRTQDAEASAEQLRQQQDASWSFKATKNRQVTDLVALRTRTAALEQQHGISLRSTEPQRLRPQDQRPHRAFSGHELNTIDRTLTRLPTAHIRDNPELNFLRREQRPPNTDHDDDTGAAYNVNDQGVGVYDVANAGPYRAQGQTSLLGGHPHGQEVTGLEDVLTHEIGHSVHAHMANAFTAFQGHAGWEALGSQVAIRGALTHGNAMQAQAANQVIDGLEQDRDRAFHQRAAQQHGGYHYLVDPDNANQYYRRRVNRIPGDAATAQSAQHDYMAYAKTSPKEHFAEMYSQMVHTPERVHADYVTAPEQRFQQARQGYEAQRATANFQDLHRLATVSQERRAQRDAMRGQWQTMREDVFGLDANAVAAARLRVQQRFTHHGRGVQAQPFLDTFDQQAEKVATPHQLAALERKHVAAANRHHQQMTELGL